MVPLPAGNPGPLTGSGNNTWLLDGAEPTLIDAGVGEPVHIDALRTALSGRPLARVLVTHGHHDHAAGLPALRAVWPGVDARKWRVAGDQPEWLPLAGLDDGLTVRAGDRDLTVLHTPGHAADHVCFWDAASRDLYGGDMLTAGGTVLVPPSSRGGSLRQYIASLERLAALGPHRILPGHGPIIEDPLELIAHYLSHRRAREAQIRECLDAGITVPGDIVARVYPDLLPALLPAAELTVEAHLEKLREDGVLRVS